METVVASSLCSMPLAWISSEWCSLLHGHKWLTTSCLCLDSCTPIKSIHDFVFLILYCHSPDLLIHLPLILSNPIHYTHLKIFIQFNTDVHVIVILYAHERLASRSVRLCISQLCQLFVDLLQFGFTLFLCLALQSLGGGGQYTVIL